MDALQKILDRYPKNESSLIQVLQDVNRAYNYLPPESLVAVSEALNVPMARIYGVATFYKAFSLKPRGKKIVKVCMGTACHIRGAQQLTEEVSRQYDVPAGGTTDDMALTLETVNCVGACAMAPVLIVNETYHGGAKPANVKKMIGEKDHGKKN